MILRSDLISAISRSAIIGTPIVFVANIICLFIAKTQADKSIDEIEQVSIITIVLAIVGVVDLVVGYYLKKKLLSPLFEGDLQPDKDTLKQYALKTTITTAAICSALPIYGLVSAFLDNNIDVMVGFSIASLAGFMVMRLRPRDFEKLKIN